MDGNKTRKMDTARRHELLSRLMDEYRDDKASVQTIQAHWDDDEFDEGDYEELAGILELF